MRDLCNGNSNGCMGFWHLEPKELAAGCTEFSGDSIRRWDSSFFISDYREVLDGVCDEEVTAELSTHLSSLIHGEEFQSAARIYMRKHACRNGEPNLTHSMFPQWIETKYGAKIHNETARRWFSFSSIHHQKECTLMGTTERMEELDRKSIKCEGTILHIKVGEKPELYTMRAHTLPTATNSTSGG